eukprot:365456-Chlamydomonas_euryale.AAC.4
MSPHESATGREPPIQFPLPSPARSVMGQLQLAAHLSCVQGPVRYPRPGSRPCCASRMALCAGTELRDSGKEDILSERG